MANDIRDRNQYFKHEEIHAYLKQYTGALANALNKVDYDELQRAKDLMRITQARNGRIFVGGNGGSAAIADHLTCDFVKGTYSEKRPALNVQSLVGNQALLTAIANDLGYEHIFSWQLLAARVCGNDLLILISSSGNSANIIDATTVAQSRGCPVIGLTGFDGGMLHKLANSKLHVPFNNYGIVEDCHQAIMHILAQFHYLSFHA